MNDIDKYIHNRIETMKYENKFRRDDESRIQRNSRRKREKRDNILSKLVPDRRCSCCGSVKLPSRAWVTINDARSALLERLSKRLVQESKIIARSAMDVGSTDSVLKASHRNTLLQRQITEVQRIGAVCRGCWIKFVNMSKD